MLSSIRQCSLLPLGGFSLSLFFFSQSLSCYVVFCYNFSLFLYVSPRDGSLLFIHISLFLVCFHGIVFLNPLFVFFQDPEHIAASAHTVSQTGEQVWSLVTAFPVRVT